MQVVVVGGANLDIKARTLLAHHPATSNPGVLSLAAGGVGRNIAENLARLGSPVSLVAAVGDDPFGTTVREATAAAGVAVDHLVTVPDGRTGTYLAVLDDHGDLVTGVADMAVTDGLTPELLAAAEPLLTRADAVILDGNLPGPVLGWALDLLAAAPALVVVDPVSVAKAHRLAPLLRPGRRVDAITPNLDELAALVDRPVTLDGLVEAAGALHARGVALVWVRQGAAGSWLCRPGEPPQHVPAVPSVVADVTGAGDALTAAFVHARLRGDEPRAAARFAAAAAALTVAVPQTVRPDLTSAAVERLLAQNGEPR